MDEEHFGKESNLNELDKRHLAQKVAFWVWQHCSPVTVASELVRGTVTILTKTANQVVQTLLDAHSEYCRIREGHRIKQLEFKGAQQFEDVAAPKRGILNAAYKDREESRKNFTSDPELIDLAVNTTFKEAHQLLQKNEHEKRPSRKRRYDVTVHQSKK